MSQLLSLSLNTIKRKQSSSSTNEKKKSKETEVGSSDRLLS